MTSQGFPAAWHWSPIAFNFTLYWLWQHGFFIYLLGKDSYLQTYRESTRMGRSHVLWSLHSYQKHFATISNSQSSCCQTFNLFFFSCCQLSFQSSMLQTSSNPLPVIKSSAKLIRSPFLVNSRSSGSSSSHQHAPSVSRPFGGGYYLQLHLPLKIYESPMGSNLKTLFTFSIIYQYISNVLIYHCWPWSLSFSSPHYLMHCGPFQYECYTSVFWKLTVYLACCWKASQSIIWNV